MQRQGFTVPPMTRDSIYLAAETVRNSLRRIVGQSSRVPLDLVYEVLPAVLDGFRLEVCERDEMGDDHGQTFPEKLFIKLRRDVYDGMCLGNGRDRFTGAHELGHLFLHQGAGKFARRIETGAQVPLYKNSEWQADCFASAFLIDRNLLPQCKSIGDVQAMFGVSEAAARARFK